MQLSHTLDGDVNFLFVSDVLLNWSRLFETLHTHIYTCCVTLTWKKRNEPGNVSRKRFEEAISCTSVNLSYLEINKLNPIVRAKRITTKYGPTVLLSIRESEASMIHNFLPKRQCAVIPDDNMDIINSNAVFLNLVYGGICETSKSYLLAIES